MDMRFAKQSNDGILDVYIYNTNQQYSDVNVGQRMKIASIEEAAKWFYKEIYPYVYNRHHSSKLKGMRVYAWRWMHQHFKENNIDRVKILYSFSDI